MIKQRKGLILSKGGKLYKIATLFWYGGEGSLYLSLNKVRNERGVGKFEVKKGRWTVRFSDNIRKVQIEHASVHKTGISHFRPAQGESIAREEGVSLKDLKVARPLWTIIPRISDDAIYKKEPKDGDFIFEEPAKISGRALYLVAFPKQDLNLQFSDQINDDGSTPDFGIFDFEVDDYLVVILLHNNDRMSEPQRTLNIPAIRNHSAWVDTISDIEATGTYKKII